jgi:predicted secreted hydrolase
MIVAKGTPLRAWGRATAGICLVAVLAACGGAAPEEADTTPRLSVREVLGGASLSGFSRALEPRRFEFPADHGAHGEFRNEWWYFTGNLVDARGERYGYQLTFFRTALASTMEARSSAWATRQAYMAHFAISRQETGQFRAHDRFSRGALGLAGVTGQPLRVWLEDWEAAALGGAAGQQTRGTLPGATVMLPPMRLRAREGGDAIDLTVRAVRPLVLNGDDGLSVKGETAGNASYYYSAPRLRTEGTLTLGGSPAEVEGLSWLDREWSTGALEPTQAGWDWFSLHLSDGRDLMVYLLRQTDGTVDPVSAGTLVEPDGVARVLARGELAIEVLGDWVSPGGTSYPARWRVQVPSAGIELEVSPLIANQEIDLAFRYWEGAVTGAGVSAGVATTAEGFVELTGYQPAR